MATVTRENIGPLNDKLTVNIAKQDYLPAFEKSLKDYAKKANIPGFRKGMVPPGLVKKMYGSSVFTDEVLRTVEKELNNYVTEEKLDILAQPLPLPSDSQRLDVFNPADYTFDFEVGYKPEINIDIHNIHVTRYKVTVTEEMVNDEINRLQIRSGKMTNPDVIDNDENVLNVELKEADAEGNPIEGGIQKDNSFLLKYFTEDVKTQLREKKVEDTILIQLSKALEPKERELVMSDLGLDNHSDIDADKYFLMTIKKIGLVEKSELNEEFFNTVYPGRNITAEEDFGAEVKKEIEAYYDAQSRSQAQDQIFHALTDHTQLQFPESFLKRWLQLNGEQQKTEEEVNEEYPKYESQLKWSLIATKLIQDNNISVSPDEIRTFAQQRLMSYMGGQNFGDLSWMEDYTNRMMQDKKFVEQSYNEIQAAKLFDILLDQVQSTEEPISADDFASKLHHHHH
ncbi:trigger factor [Ilyomonas limi]|uniref:Trigger factor n=1 Tax=Ilyomonas limi TaxID=2575867 RepID=A0A4U3KX95_9BACT|nr:trigger factor [Ilyomonas limi]TKK67241.1 trigger factor [Ilyomonas limi]